MRELSAETLRLILLCVVLGAVVGMGAANSLGFLFWIVLALTLLWLGVWLWPQARVQIRRWRSQLPEGRAPRRGERLGERE